MPQRAPDGKQIDTSCPQKSLFYKESTIQPYRKQRSSKAKACTGSLWNPGIKAKARTGSPRNQGGMGKKEKEGEKPLYQTVWPNGSGENPPSPEKGERKKKKTRAQGRQETPEPKEPLCRNWLANARLSLACNAWRKYRWKTK